MRVHGIKAVDELRPIGHVESPLVDRAAAPKQGTPILDLKPVLDPALEK